MIAEVIDADDNDFFIVDNPICIIYTKDGEMIKTYVRENDKVLIVRKKEEQDD